MEMQCSSSEVVVYLSLGSNLGNRKRVLEQAVQEISKRIGTIVSQSAFFVTKPWGFESENEFLNLCVGVRTCLNPSTLLSMTQQIEHGLGRTEKSRNGKYSDRIVDIDILLYGQLTIASPELCIPHPLMSQRLFVLEPLAQIAPDVLVPTFQKTVRELLAAASSAATQSATR